MRILMIFATLSLCILSCSKDDSPEIIESSEKEILSFDIKISHNLNLSEDVIGTISEATKEIDLLFPFNTNIDQLKPVVTVAQRATISPNPDAYLDFSVSRSFEVTAEDGSKASYVVKSTVLENSDAKILNFDLLALNNNDGSGEGQLIYDITGEINEDERSITLSLPSGTYLNKLVPTIGISMNATIDPPATEYLKSDSVYTVTAEDGSTQEYQIIYKATPNERQILIDFYLANPGNSLGWDISSYDIDSWDGVTVRDARVTNFSIKADNGITTITPEIGLLEKISLLQVVGNPVNALPKELFDIKDLTDLNISATNITSIPNEIGNATELGWLLLNGNQIASLPEEIGNLKKLTILQLSSNNLSSLPEGISGLSNLRTFWLMSNNLSVLPNNIGNLSNLQVLNLRENSLQQLPESIGNLSNLAELNLNYNNLTSLPNSISGLTGLKELSLSVNDLTEFPISIFDLKDNLELLGLNLNDLGTIPNGIGDMQALTSLGFNQCNLNELPEEIGNLTKLQSLFVPNNNFTIIPQKVCDLTTNYGTVITTDDNVVCQ